jgi:hypothetical protein
VVTSLHILDEDEEDHHGDAARDATGHRRTET